MRFSDLLNIARHWRPIGKQMGMISFGAVLSMAILAYIVMLFIVNFTPQMEADVSSANISNPFTASMVDMSVWLVPVILIALVFIGLSRRIKGGSKKGGD